MLGKWRQMDSGERMRFVAKRGVLSIVGTFLGITTMVAVTADEALAPLHWVADVHYDDTFWHMNGDVGITGLSITPFDGAASERISVEKITVHTPGFLWLVRAAAASRKQRGVMVAEDGTLEPSLPAMDAVGVTIEGLRFAAESYFPEELSWVGVDSAAPFEALGCGDEDYFSAGELRDMGLPDSRQLLRFRAEATAYDLVRLGIELSTPGVSTVRIARTLRVRNARDYVTLLAEGVPSLEGKHVDTVVEVEDHGFVRARNALCAQRLAMTEQAFVERHLAAVRRLALVHGAIPADDVLATYRDYATRGGTVALRSAPMTAIPEEDWDQFSPDDQFKLRNVSYVRDGREAALAMRFVEPRPLPADPTQVSLEDEVSAELALERQLALGLGTRGAEARARRAPTPEAPVALVVEPPKPALPERGRDIAYEELAKLVGRKVKINTTQMINRLATVEAYTAEAVRLKVHFTGGSATYTVPRGDLTRIIMM